jgi:MoaA/NifB/PqqE/SkfB family radical SAM enzyme
MSYIKEILPKIIRYRLYRLGLSSPGTPLNLTFSVTNLCQSRCKTCSIWKLYRDNPSKRAEELTIDEIERIFKSMGHIYLFNVSGGEPFLRKDLIQIIELACRYLTPAIIHIPTNAIAVDTVEKETRNILDIIRKIKPDIQLTVKPSLDHAGDKHDDIRGIEGNYKKVEEVFRRLKGIKSEYSNLHVELGTVISSWNVNDIEEISRFAMGMKPDSYRNEIAEKRAEMFNMEEAITPGVESYKKAVDLFIREIEGRKKSLSFFQRINNAFRLVYYHIAIRIMEENRQVIPCYAGISNAHMSPYGDIWPCCTLGYDKSMGNLRSYDYNFRSLWSSPDANKIRRYIKDKNCSCPLANQTYSNILMHLPSLLNVIREIILS